MKISKTTERWSPLIVLVGILLLWQLFVMTQAHLHACDAQDTLDVLCSRCHA